MVEMENKMEEVNGKLVLVTKVNSLTHEQEDSLAHKLIDKHPNLVLFLAVDNGAKKDLVAARGSALNDIKAGNIMKDASKMLNGRGGGRPDVAFGGSETCDHLDLVKEYVKGLLK